MALNEETKRIISGVILASIVGFGSAFVGVHKESATANSRIKELENKIKYIKELDTEIEDLRLKSNGLEHLVLTHSQIIEKMGETVEISHQSSITSLKTLETVARSQENLVKVAGSLQIAVTKLETLVSYNLVKPNVATGGTR